MAVPHRGRQRAEIRVFDARCRNQQQWPPFTGSFDGPLTPQDNGGGVARPPRQENRRRFHRNRCALDCCSARQSTFMPGIPRTDIMRRSSTATSTRSIRRLRASRSNTVDRSRRRPVVDIACLCESASDSTRLSRRSGRPESSFQRVPAAADVSWFGRKCFCVSANDPPWQEGGRPVFAALLSSL